MKKLITIIATGVALTASSMAGPATPASKMVTPMEELYGVGWYGAIYGGINAYQSKGSGRTLATTDGDLSFRAKNDVGGFGGLKLGYVFGTAFVRPALEADMFYNGWNQTVDTSFNDIAFPARSGSRSYESSINSGAFLANCLLRFDYKRLQPYFGFGIGYWVAEANQVTFSVPLGALGTETFRTNSSSKGDLAWQLIAGCDYYFNPKLSMFLEYKYLNYENAVFDDAVRQQLVGLGVRMHF